MNIDYFICLSNTDLDDWTGYKKQILVHLFSTYIRIKMNTDSYITSFSGSNNSSSHPDIYFYPCARRWYYVCDTRNSG